MAAGKLMMTFFMTLIYCLTEKYVFGEIITLQSEKDIHCVTDHTQLPLYLSPPIIETAKERNIFLETDFWTKSNWKMQNANNLTHTAITDKRWEDFETLKTNYLQFFYENSISLSAYGPYDIDLYLNDGTNIDYIQFNRTKKGWTHLTVLFHNGNTIVLENDIIVVTITEFKSKQFVFKSKNETYWKMHKYNFMWSNEVTTRATTFTVPAPGKACVMLYVTLCKNCILIIPEFNRRYKSDDSLETIFNFWQVDKLEIKIKRKMKITLIKETIDGTTSGEWGIDIRECPVIIDNRLIYKKSISKVNQNNYTCQVLKDRLTEENFLSTNTDSFHCDPGKLGEICEVKCENILGRKHKFCEEHRICHGTKCRCAWGSTLSDANKIHCSKKCEPGKWGLDCINDCKSECTTCSSENGKCSVSTIVRGILPKVVVFLVILMILVISYLLFKKRFQLHENRQNDVHQNHEETPIITNN
ncbi:unnamed protein product [Tenebrio molitor]|nr:unnamed protein product [Tenebrio molitor]